MSFLTELKARRKKGPGSVDVYFTGDDKPIVVPLKYPSAASQAEVMALLNDIDEDATGTAAFEQNARLNRMVVMLCIDGGDKMEDEDLEVLIRESGGATGLLAQRCFQLMGFGGSADREANPSKGAKRGR